MAVKLVFGLALLFFIVWKVYNDKAWNELENIRLTDSGLLYIVLACSLMPINWLLESTKFKYLMNQIQKLSWKGSFLSVLAGISTGLLTPNRIGSFIGRTIYVNQTLKRKAVFITLYTNLAQFLATIIFGTIGLAILGISLLEANEIAIYSVTSIALILGLYLYIRPAIMLSFIPSRFISDRTHDALSAVDESKVSDKIWVLSISLIRYVVFLLQFYLFLAAFYASTDLFLVLAALSVVFLVTTLIPSFLFGKLFVREASALFVLSQLGIPSSVILITVFILWCVNLALPAVFGSLVLIRDK